MWKSWRATWTAGFLKPSWQERLTADELLSRYCTLIYSHTHSYERATKDLELDRRTVKSKVNSELWARLFTT
jgi:hypothetical protein